MTEETKGKARTRRSIPELIQAAEQSIKYHEGLILSAQERIGKLRDQQLAAEKKAISKELLAKLEKAAEGLPPGKVLELLQQASEASGAA